MARLRARAALLIFVAVAGCGRDNPTAPTPPATLIGLSIFGAPMASVGVGQTVHLRAVERWSNNTSVPITFSILWTSSSPGVATIASDGTVFASSAGSSTITASHSGFNTTATVRVVTNWTDLDFRVAILNGTSGSKPSVDVERIFAKANDLLFERTGSHMRLIDMSEVGPGTSTTLAANYLATWSGEQPDGIVVWSEDPTAVSAGGFSQTVGRPAPYQNRFPGVSGSGRVYVSSIHYEHKYGRCGYDTTGSTRISDRSGGGECRNQSGLMCVDNGRFWECPGVQNDFYAQPDVFTATVIVHEFMHPFGPAGNNDHYGTSTCMARVGMSTSESSDLARSQWHCGQCPDLFLGFRPTGAPSAARREK